VTQLDEEGVIQVLRHPLRGDQQPVFAAVGPMQYEVAVHRLETEYGAKVELSPTPFTVARRTDAAGAAVLAGARDVDVLERQDGTLLALFRNIHRLEATVRDHPEVLLDPIVIA
jgi:peptide chain release factor 3